MTKYIPLFRPASFATLPRGLSWAYAEVPSYITKRPDLPTSQHTHGVIECRDLTQEEVTAFDLREVSRTTTFEDFQATRRHCDDLGEAINDARWEGEPETAKGYLYLDALYIEQVLPHWPEQARKAGRWCLMIGNNQEITDDLERLERDLFAWAQAEGYFDAA